MTLATIFAGCLGTMASVLCVARAADIERRGSPGLAALGYALPIAVTALMATLLGQVPVALGVIFGSSVAMLSGASGFVLISGPAGAEPPPQRGTWAFAPVPALLLFVLGLGGTLGPLEAVILLAQGVLVLLVWSSRKDTPWPSHPWHSEGVPPERPEAASRGKLSLAWVWLIPGLLLAVLSAYLCTRGLGKLERIMHTYPGAVLGATLLSVVLTMPAISAGVPQAVHGRAPLPLTSHLGVVMLNICVILPLVILLAGGWHWWISSRPATRELFEVSFPRAAWRIDALAVLILSVVYAAAGEGRLRLSRQVGALLVFAFCAYLLSRMVLLAGR